LLSAKYSTTTKPLKLINKKRKRTKEGAACVLDLLLEGGAVAVRDKVIQWCQHLYSSPNIARVIQEVLKRWNMWWHGGNKNCMQSICMITKNKGQLK
jgi:hypothetical protein